MLEAGYQPKAPKKKRGARTVSSQVLHSAAGISFHHPNNDYGTLTNAFFHCLAFVAYSLFVLGFSTYMIYKVVPRCGNKTPVVNISICSFVGSITVMASKGFGIALKLTFSGSNQLTHPSTYVFAVLVGVCIVVQMNYFNKALDMFSTNV